MAKLSIAKNSISKCCGANVGMKNGKYLCLKCLNYCVTLNKPLGGE